MQGTKYLLLQVRGLHGPDFSVQARPGPHGYNLGPARPEVKKKISARARPGPIGKLKFRPEPGPARNEIEISA